jgi:glucose-6-phosphate 1-dehydrogenase
MNILTDAQKITIPTSVVLLGATGDLAQKKLLISFFHLFQKGLLPERFFLLGVSKDAYTDETYRVFVRERLEKNGAQNERDITDFLSRISYVSGVFDDTTTFERIRESVKAYDTRIGMCTAKLFYIATHPRLYELVFDKIAHTKLEASCDDGIGWTRVLVEKPFGSNLETARNLDKKLSTLFKEEQIYRIDHYLAKHALQNILAFRFSNIFFENRWNRRYIKSVTIRATEAFGVENRGAFFDGVGALRDVGQNHILQMLALIGMEYPAQLSAANIRTERARVLEHLARPQKKNMRRDIVKAQYEGYTTIPDVARDSLTETYFAIKTHINNGRWRGVPFYLEHGKGMQENKVEIVVRFRESRHCVRPPVEGVNEVVYENVVHFTISPQEEIIVRFWARTPGSKYTLEPRDFVFLKSDEKKAADALARDGYEGVLFDALAGDQTSFVSSREQTAQWRFVTRLLELWHDTTPLLYAKGSVCPVTSLTQEIHDTLSE